MAIVRRPLGIHKNNNNNKRRLVGSLLLPTRRNYPLKRRKLNTTNDVDLDNAGGTDTALMCNSPPTTSSSTIPLDRSDFVVTPPPSGKRVRFATAEDYDDQCQEHPEDPTTSSNSTELFVVDKEYLKEHKSDLWYPKSHRLEQQQEVQQLLVKFRNSHPKIVAQFADLYRSMTTTMIHNDDVNNCSDASLLPKPVALPLELHGLEWGLTPQLKARRKRHFQHVLECADDITLPSSFQEVMRRSMSTKSSRTAVAMARLYAQPEAIMDEPTDPHEDDDDDSSSCSSEDEEEAVDDTTSIKTTARTSILPSSCALEAAATTSKPLTGLPPRQPLQSKRMCLWQR